MTLSSQVRDLKFHVLHRSAEVCRLKFYMMQFYFLVPSSITAILNKAVVVLEIKNRLFTMTCFLILRFSVLSLKAKDCGQLENKWLMINIQNVQDFACQCLNRDVWSNDAVKTIIREHFIFWQV